jgi:hypothetical protein
MLTGEMATLLYMFETLLKIVDENLLGCATLLPVKYFQISGEPKIFSKSGQNFTGKSVAQASVPSFYF